MDTLRHTNTHIQSSNCVPRGTIDRSIFCPLEKYPLPGRFDLSKWMRQSASTVTSSKEPLSEWYSWNIYSSPKMSLFTWLYNEELNRFRLLFLKGGVEIKSHLSNVFVDMGPSSQRKVTCCFYADADIRRHTHKKHTQILNSLSVRLMKRGFERKVWRHWSDVSSHSKSVSVSLSHSV